ncbi:hypothetical protein Z043_123446, partial [Scleropages formosus]
TQGTGSSHSSPSHTISRPIPMPIRSASACTTPTHTPQDSLISVGGDIKEAFSQALLTTHEQSLSHLQSLISVFRNKHRPPCTECVPRTPHSALTETVSQQDLRLAPPLGTMAHRHAVLVFCYSTTAAWGRCSRLSYEDFKAHFQAMFGLPCTDQTASDPSAANYAVEFRILAEKSGWDQNALLACFRRGYVKNWCSRARVEPLISSLKPPSHWTALPGIESPACYRSHVHNSPRVDLPPPNGCAGSSVVSASTVGNPATSGSNALFALSPLPYRQCGGRMKIIILDGQPLGKGYVETQTEPLHLRVGACHKEQLQFYLISAPETPVILGFPWLAMHDPIFKWRTEAGSETESNVDSDFGRAQFEDLVPSPTSEKNFLAQINARKPGGTDDADDNSYENDSVLQLENELKMEELLKQSQQEKTYMMNTSQTDEGISTTNEDCCVYTCEEQGLLGQPEWNEKMSSVSLSGKLTPGVTSPSPPPPYPAARAATCYQ